MPRSSYVHICECPVCEGAALEEAAAIRAHHHRMNLLLSRLDERQRRWYAALQSYEIGRGGDRLVSRITGLSEKTIRRGRRELDSGLATCPPDRVRNPGGGRPTAEARDAMLESAFVRILELEAAGGQKPSSTRGSLSLRQLSSRLAQEGHQAGRTTVARLLRKFGLSPRRTPQRNVL